MEFHRFDSRPTPAKINRKVRILRIIRTIGVNIPNPGDHASTPELEDSGIKNKQLRFDFRRGENDPDRSGSFSAERLSEIRMKIAAGFYDSPEFMDKLADKLIDKLYLHQE